MKRLSIICALLVMGCPLLAQTQVYTLDDCKEMAIKNNTKLKNEMLDREIATQTSKGAFTKYFPQIDAVGFMFKNNNGIAEIDMLAALGMETEIVQKGKIASLNAMMPIFAGRQVATGNKLAKINEQVAALNYTLAEDEVNLNVEKMFWQIVMLQEKKKTVNAALAQLDRLHKDVSLAVKAGISTRNDLLRVELQQQKYESKKLKLENGIMIMRMQMGQYIGVGFSEFEVSAGDMVEIESPLPYHVNSAEVVSKRSEYQLLNQSVDAARLQKQMEMGKYMPKVAVGASYVYHDFVEKDHTFGIAYAGVSVPISDWWGGSHAIRKEKYKLEQAENERANTIELLQVQIEQMWYELQEAYKQVILAQKSIDSSKENMKQNEDYYKAGVGVISDVLDAQTLLQESNDQYTEACSQYKITLLRYLQVTGRN